jgi:hypothetical protein
MMYFEMANYWLCLMKWRFYLSLLDTSSKYILNSLRCMMGCFLDGPHTITIIATLGRACCVVVVPCVLSDFGVYRRDWSLVLV